MGGTTRNEMQTNWQKEAGIGGGATQEQETGWTGWIVFAGTMLAVVGVFQVMQGLAALFNDGFYAVRPSGLVINVNYDTWGWTHLVLGVIAILTGAGLLRGNIVARIVGVLIAVLSAIVNLAFAAAYPLWSVVIITFDVFIIYAITVHGREMKSRH